MEYKKVKVFTRAELTEDNEGRMHKVIESSSGNRTMIPINKDGSVKWFDDSKLVRKSEKSN